ncbi:MAG: putative DNA binding domain-containing protein [Hydrogenophaga sp.]|uniref:Fic family protein n=1 Tax=Hydrogenophaga sp. TaxID=1904254 RepID=UPI002715C870|nr:RNA-binding domain-containing protein [Hydrogenophaga sp.]MDO9482927.1 putative DNA binding domain-containing protein [Hydrogenophaga sp.]MDP3345733.1 putative DNA binding domain-containing protein [Hydrogenophaga sp.]MDP3808206.1 putative DNA binding domain-containing protein [Hydrogenophaga sp.]MDP3925146.1 putative DNA binding domain-containing protein [Hydrogenophaga sp.]
MTESELLQLLACGEDSRHQFKRDATNADSLAAELAALANSGGGCLLLGVADDGTVSGLDAAAVRRLNQLLSNAASQHVRPPLSPVSHNVLTAQGLVMVVQVPDGLNKPYMDLQGRVWVKSGADKRHVTAREEMQRMFQRAGLLQADQVPVHNATAADIDERAFGRYFERRYGQSLEAAGLPVVQLMENLQLAQDGVPNLAGLLLFGKQPQRLLQVCQIGAVWFPGTFLGDTRYLDSENIDGTLEEQFQRGMAFIKRSLHHVQGGRGFNTLGQLEVPEEAFVELLVNALVHRDFLVSATIRLFVFTDRVEIISPGHLPDSLTAEQIRTGVSNRRNKVLAEHAAHILPYRGLGTGVPRALGAWPKIDLVDEREANQFRAVVWRVAQPSAATSVDTPQVTGQVTGQVRRLLAVMVAEHSRSELQALLGLKHRDSFMASYLLPALAAGWVEMTIPDKPQSSKQRYRLTPAGKIALTSFNKDTP